MAKELHDLEIGLEEDLKEILVERFPNYASHRILKQSVDARRSSETPHWVYSVLVYEKGDVPATPDYSPKKVSWGEKSKKPIIIGTGPAGLFCAVRLLERGIRPIIFERGSVGEKRIMKINRFWRFGELDLDNNVCMGEGGAGLYSDGKLITRIKSPHIPYVMDRLVNFGAPEEIRWLSNPHVGSDKIRRVIPKIREFLIEGGCEIHFDTPVSELLINKKQPEDQKIKTINTASTRSATVIGVRTAQGKEFYSDHIVLATGHSAEDIFYHLKDLGIFMEGKSYALGLRIEHPQETINKIQYRKAWNHPKLGAANYRLADHNPQTGIGVYSFCMCPGGYVLSSGTEPGGVVANGMSNYRRNSGYANSAIVVSIDHEKRFGKNVFAGLEFRKRLEQKAFQAVQDYVSENQLDHKLRHALPSQGLLAFLEGRASDALPTSSPSGAVPVRLDMILPDDIVKNLRTSLLSFDKKMKGFLSDKALLHGIESRTSCPIRITRNKNDLQSVSHGGLYPTGEGAGYAGGITSAACDGVRVADQIAESTAKS